MTTYFYQWLKLWRWFDKRSLMPYSNMGWFEHPWKIIRVFELFDSIAAGKRNK